MEVRRNPRTTATFGRQAFAQAENTDSRALLAGAANLRAGLDATRRSNQQFELQKRLLEETNNLTADLEKRRQDPNFDADNFSTTVDFDYTDAANALVDEFQQKGYDPDLLNDFALGLTRTRNALTDKATVYQINAQTQRAFTDSGKLIDEGSKTVMDSPDSYLETQSYIRDTIAMNPYLTDEDRTKLYTQSDVTLRNIAAESLRVQKPEYILEQLDPDRRWRSERAAIVAGAAPQAGGVLPETDPAVRIMNYEARAVGIDTVPADVKTLGDASAFARRVNKAGADSSAMGVYQIVGSTMRQYGPKVFGAGWETQQFNFASQDALAKAIFEDHVYSAKALKGQWVSLTTEEAERIRKLPWEEARILIAKKESGADLSGLQTAPAIQTTVTRTPVAGEVLRVDLPASTVPQNAPDGTISPPNLEQPSEARSLHPALAALTGDERLRILAAADKQVAQQVSNIKAEMDLRLENLRAQSANGAITSPIPTPEELTPIYGEVAATQIVAEITTLQQRGTLMKDWESASTAEIDAELATLRPSQNDPALATKLPIYEQAKQARDAIIKKRLEDPAAYAIAVNPAIQQAIASGDSRKFYALQRAEQARLGIPEGQRNPWPQEYIEGEKKRYKMLNPQSRYDWFVRHRTGATQTEFENFVKEFDGTEAYDDLLMSSMVARTRGQKEMLRVLPLILQGSAIIRQDPAKRPPREQMLQQFQGALLNGVLQTAPDLSRSIRNAADALYVARGNDPAKVNPQAYQESLREAVGGRYGDSSTGWANYSRNGVKDLTILPAGISRDQFDNWLTGLTTSQLAGLAVNGAPRYATGEPVTARDIIDEGVLVMVAPNTYTVKFRQSGSVVEGAFGADNKPIRFTITPQTVVNRIRPASTPVRQALPVPRF